MAGSFSFRRSLCMEWKVKNIFQANNVQTEEFTFSGSRCKFLLQLHGIRENERAVIYLLRKKLYKRPLNEIRINMFIEDRNGKSQFPMGLDSSYEDFKVWEKYVSELSTKGEIFQASGAVTFVCMLALKLVSVHEFERDVSTQTDANIEPRTHLECLSLDFHHLMDDSLLSDVTLKCGGRSIPAHRNILSARSEVFLAMLRSDMAESRKGIIEISDMEPSTLDQLLRYIYSGKVSDLSVDSALQLYAAADKYAIDSLRIMCGNFLKDNLKAENACSVLILADTHSDRDIKDFVLSFIMETKLLRDKDHWLKFLKEHPVLATEVIHHMYIAQCSSQVDKKTE